VERGAIRRYAEAIGDPNPLYRDEEYARQSSHGTMIAPPVFTGWPISAPQSVRVESPFFRHVTGGTELLYERPIRAGERLVATAELVELYEKEGRPGVGRMLFQILETTYRDLNGKVVVVQRTTDITFEG
jgi:acyl dehydratase